MVLLLEEEVASSAVRRKAKGGRQKAEVNIDGFYRLALGNTLMISAEIHQVFGES